MVVARQLSRWGARLHRLLYLRYIGASVAALAADMGLFLLLLAASWSAVLASAASYSTGIIVHWLISTRLVFVHAAKTSGLDRTRQKALFLASAFVGLALTVAIVAIGDGWGFDPRLAKLAAIGVSFQTTYVLRKTLVFSGS